MPEKEINGQPLSPWPGGHQQLEGSVHDGHILVRRDNVDVVRSNLHPILCLLDLHGRDALEQFWHYAFVGRVEMGHEHKGQPSIGWHIAEELVKSFQRSG